jgi:hypothetical protein
MSQVSRACSEDEPLMIAWRKYQASEDYANTVSWMGEPKSPQQHDGTLWAAFMAGFLAAAKGEQT